jgi:hypothetical protein
VCRWSRALLSEAAGQPLLADLELLAQERRRLEAERAVVLAQRAGWEQAEARLDDLQDWCRRMALNLETLTYDERRAALTTLGVEVLGYRADHTPRYEITARIPLTPWRDMLRATPPAAMGEMVARIVSRSSSGTSSRSTRCRAST